MDWETLLAMTGLYITLLACFAHQWIMNKRIINLTSTTNETLNFRRELITKTAHERERNQQQKSEVELND